MKTSELQFFCQSSSLLFLSLLWLYQEEPNQGSFLYYLEFVACTLLVIFVPTVKPELLGIEKFGGSWYRKVPNPLQVSARAVSSTCVLYKDWESGEIPFFFFLSTNSLMFNLYRSRRSLLQHQSIRVFLMNNLQETVTC